MRFNQAKARRNFLSAQERLCKKNSELKYYVLTHVKMDELENNGRIYIHL